MSAELDFRHSLEAELRDSPPPRKGEVTRRRLRLAAATAMEAAGYHDLRVGDIAAGAGVSPPTFYLYFRNRHDIASDVLLAFGRFLFDHIRDARAPDDALGAIRAGNLVFMRVVQANPGLIRSAIQLSDEDDAFRKVAQETVHRWYLHMSHGIARRLGLADPDDPRLLLATYLLGGMVDQLLRDLHVLPNPHIDRVIAAAAPSTEELADLISAVWYQALVAALPQLADPAP